MRAVERLFWARCDFDDSWRAHAASLRAVTLISGFFIEAEPRLQAMLSNTDGLEVGFDSVFQSDSLLFELEFLKGEDFFPMRKNCLLGVCSSFENFAKTYAAALRYEPGWQLSYERYQSGPQSIPPSSGLLTQDTSTDFDMKFATEDKAWRGNRAKFFNDNFPWLAGYAIEWIDDLFWLRNQLTHNADIAKNDRQMSFCQTGFVRGEKIVLGGELLGACVKSLREIAKWIAEPTPYFEAI